jgi:HEAT repeat protein
VAAFGILVDALSNAELAVAAESALAERVRRMAGAKDAGDAHAQLAAALARALETAKTPAQATLIADLVVSVSDVMPTTSLSPALTAALERGQGDPRELSKALAATASPDALVPLLERLSRVGAPESADAQSGLAPAARAQPSLSADALAPQVASRATSSTGGLPDPSDGAIAADKELLGGGQTVSHASISAIEQTNFARKVGARSHDSAISLSAQAQHNAAPANVNVLSTTSESGALGVRAGAAPKANAELDSLLDALLQYAATAPSDGRAADPLIPQLSVAVPTATRVKIIRLLGWSGAARALPALQRELASPQLDVQLAAVDAIGRIGSPDGMAAVQPLLDAPRADLRLAAARAYGVLAREAEVTALLARLDGKGAADRTALLTAAGLALGRLRAGHSLAPATTKAALQTLGRFVANPDLEVSATALDALRRFGDDGATPIVARELLSPKQSRRATATFALADFPGDETRRLLRFVLQRSAPRAGIAALLALGEVGDQRDLTAVQRMARFAHWPLPAAATFALRRIAGRADVKKRALERSLCELGHLRDPYARANIASSLAALGGNGCTEFDVRTWYAASEPSVVRAAAARFLRARAEQLDTSEPDLLRLLATCSSDPDPLVRAACEPTRGGRAQSASPVEIVAYDADGQTPLRNRLVALRFADASAFVGYTDANARVLLQRAPAGPVVLENPGE